MHLLRLSVMARALALVVALLLGVVSSIDVDILLPDAPEENGVDVYVCAAVHLPPSPHRLVGVVPRARMDVVHHILLFGCTVPHVTPAAEGQTSLWNCNNAPTCAAGSSQIIYGWGRNAPELQLPEGVGFSVGPATPIRFIVAQVHYLGSKPLNDHSGVTLRLLPRATPQAAGLIAFATGFTIPPGLPSYLVENECCYSGNQAATTFAARGHTHTLGKVVYAERPTAPSGALQRLIERDPQIPQAFYPTDRHTIVPGDRIKVTCDFNSTSKRQPTYAGPTHEHEMCNLYVMLFAPRPYIAMCDGVVMVGPNNPGAMPQAGESAFVTDPSPRWHPPGAAGNTAQQQQELGDASNVAIAPDGSLWVTYRHASLRMLKERVLQRRLLRSSQQALGRSHQQQQQLQQQQEATDWQRTLLVEAGEVVEGTGQQQQEQQGDGPHASLARLDPDTGAVLAVLRGPLQLPHGLRVDRAGSVWVVDAGRRAVIRMSPQGGVQAEWDAGQLGGPAGQQRLGFCKPQALEVLPDGSFMVADGRCGQSLVHFDRDFNIIAEVSDPLLAGAHDLLAMPCEQRVYVAVAGSTASHVIAVEAQPTFTAAPSGEGALPLRMRVLQTYDLARYGVVRALARGPYGEVLALTARLDKSASIVDIKSGAEWTLPQLPAVPHGLALGAAGTELTGAGERLIAAYVTFSSIGCSAEGDPPLAKLVLLPHGTVLPSPQLMEQRIAEMGTAA